MTSAAAARRRRRCRRLSVIVRPPAGVAPANGRAGDTAQVKAEYSITYPFGGAGGGAAADLQASRLAVGAGGGGGGKPNYPDGLGLWLETDVENDCVVVKRVKPKSYADVEEDVRAGDQVT